MKKINLIQTGGTIAMELGKPAGQNRSKWADVLHTEIPELSMIAELHLDKVFMHDSSEINPTHWKILLEHIEKVYEQYDGFVILHGTDTMAYTATALSFGLKNLDKPVILTGSQIPLKKLRSDARRNLVNAVELSTLPVREVAVCFNDHLYRGNRTTKMSIGDFNAFASPNYPPLAEVGLDIQLHATHDKPSAPLEVNTRFNNRLALIKLYPGLDPGLFSDLPEKQISAVIVEAFGSGNFPVDGPYGLRGLMESYRDAGMEIIITSQAPYDSVDLSLYESGRTALELGAIGAGDMTVEATLIKTMYLLGNKVAGDEFKTRFETGLAGERTQSH